MSKNLFGFHSAFAGMLTGFVREKRAVGYKYGGATLRALRSLDRFFSSCGADAKSLSRNLGEHFISRHAKTSPCAAWRRALVWRQFAEYCRRQGMDAWSPEYSSFPIYRVDFCPFIYTRPQVASLFAAVDVLPRLSRTPRRTANYSLLFRLLYGAGLRIGEALALRICDWDQTSGVLRICQGKNRKDRLIPLSPKLADRVTTHIRQYADEANMPLFLSPQGNHTLSCCVINHTFRNTLLPQAGLPPRHKRQGPRIHDLRHTFAVHRLENWFLAGENIEAKLPYLAAYMGHTNIRDTYYYLRITQSFFPEITRRLEAKVGDIIPRMEDQP